MSDLIKPARRIAWVTGLDSDKAAYYEDLHAHPWPEVNAMIKACHMNNFSIHKTQIGGNYYLFAYFEYDGEDFDADMAKMAQHEKTREWWHETDPCQVPLPDAASAGKIWSDMTEVFYLA